MHFWPCHPECRPRIQRDAVTTRPVVVTIRKITCLLHGYDFLDWIFTSTAMTTTCRTERTRRV